MSLYLRSISLQIAQLHLALAIGCMCFAGCGSRKVEDKQSIEITRVPPAASGGPERMDTIEGHVTGTNPGQQVVIYAKNGAWWVQPFANHPFTTIGNDGMWRSSTHLGADYAALIVEPGYHPEPKSENLPEVGAGVIAVVTKRGSSLPSPALKTIHFSGYDWIVRSAPSERGGEMNYYDPVNVWTDKQGYLHLRMGERDGQWTCAEVNLTRSLGYGTYKFVVQDSAHLSDSAVLGIFTLDERLSEQSRPEMDIELSQWGKPGGRNAQYVIQPYYVPINISRFVVPPGVVTHVFRWEPGTAAFNSARGPSATPDSRGISEHVFKSGVPVAGGETIHLDLYDFFHSKSTALRPSEVVIERFEYLP